MGMTVAVAEEEARDTADDNVLKYCDSPFPLEDLNDAAAMISFSLF